MAISAVNGLTLSNSTNVAFCGNNQPRVKTGIIADEFVAREAKPAASGLRNFFRSAVLAMGIGVAAASCSSNSSIVPLPPDPPTPPTTISETQKTFSSNFDKMYNMPTTTKAAAVTPALVGQFTTMEQGQIYDRIYDYSVPDTVKTNVTVSEADGRFNSVKKELTYLENGVQTTKSLDPVDIQSFDAKKWLAEPYTSKFTVDPADSKVIESFGTANFKYIPKDETTVVQKSLKSGAESVIKILKKVLK